MVFSSFLRIRLSFGFPIDRDGRNESFLMLVLVFEATTYPGLEK